MLLTIHLLWVKTDVYLLHILEDHIFQSLLPTVAVFRSSRLVIAGIFGTHLLLGQNIGGAEGHRCELL